MLLEDERVMEEAVKKLQKLLNASNNIVFFGGAGVSVESGIPDFRSPDGLYHRKNQYAFAPEEMLSSRFFYEHTAVFFEFYRTMLSGVLKARPNDAHKGLARLEKAGKLQAVITQNIDGLHQMAGSRAVYELHGSVCKNTCLKCGERFSAEDVLKSGVVPGCPCGGMIKPDVVLYGEALDEEVVAGAIAAIARADMLIIGGTSLVVYPAAAMIDYFRGDKLVLMNKEATPRDERADLVIHENIGKVFSSIKTGDEG